MFFSSPKHTHTHTSLPCSEMPHLRARTNTLGAVMRVRDSTAHALQSHLRAHDFFQVHTPVLTAADAEGAGEVFQVCVDGESAAERERFFGEKAYLNVSGQLEAEMFASALGRVYTFGPTFRYAGCCACAVCRWCLRSLRCGLGWF
jgi:asparaginyl-tRNA synthetase